MLIAVVSDTHRQEYYIQKVKSYIKNADILIHLGDNIEDADELAEGFKGKVYKVSGNCDFCRGAERELVIDVEGIRILITHGDRYGVKYELNNLYYRAMDAEADIALYGHTHIPYMEEVNGIWLFNPGSASLPRMSKNSIGFIEIDKKGNAIPYLRQI